MLSEAAPAKINLCLRVLGRREDGYHLLDSLAVFAAIGDRLSGEAAAATRLQITGPFAAGLAAGPENLVLRAAVALSGVCGVAAGAALSLHKALPVASGMGGGSADAAAALRLLMRLWDVALPAPDLVRLAAGLGADVPVCLAGQPARMGGVGEILAALPPLPRCGLVLVNPGVGVSTAAVFGAYAVDRTGFSTAAPVPMRDWRNAAALAADMARLGNDLQAPALRLCPPIGSVLAALGAAPGCHLAQMSGSGATCFGLFDSPEDAAAAVPALRHPGWWVWGGALADQTVTRGASAGPST